MNAKLPSLEQTQTVLIIGAALVVAYVAWKAYQAAKAGAAFAGDKLTEAQTGTANLLEKLLPLTPEGPMITYAVRFPEDGLLHAVNGEDIDKGGFFYRNDRLYLLSVDQYDNKIAVPQPGKGVTKGGGK